MPTEFTVENSITTGIADNSCGETDRGGRAFADRPPMMPAPLPSGLLGACETTLLNHVLNNREGMRVAPRLLAALDACLIRDPAPLAPATIAQLPDPFRAAA